MLKILRKIILTHCSRQTGIVGPETIATRLSSCCCFVVLLLFVGANVFRKLNAPSFQIESG